MTKLDISSINFAKGNGLIPACIQDAASLQILMLGYMNSEALQQTLTTQYVTFYSRTKKRLWVKGESSGHYLKLIDIALDCDNDSLLCLVKPEGVTCHQGTSSCFNFHNVNSSLWFSLSQLYQIIELRSQQPSQKGSYTQQLLNTGIKRIAQKVGEEGVEVALAAVTSNSDEMINETVDLLYHLLVLLVAKQISLVEVSSVIQNRSKA